MKAFILLAVMSFALSGCTLFGKAPLCDVGKTTASAVAGVIAVQAGCSNVDAIQADLVVQLENIKICEKPLPAGPVGEIICEPLVDGLLAGGLSSLPTKWGCSGGPAKENLKEFLLNACRKI